MSRPWMKPFLQTTTKRMFWRAILTAAIVFCTTLASGLISQTVLAGKIIVYSAALSALAAFLQTFREFYIDEQKRKHKSVCTHS